MGRAPCCDKANVKKGPWSPEEDAKLKAYIESKGTGGNWIALPQKIGIKRCGKSCRLRWLNYLRPNIRHGGFSDEEDNIICSLYLSIGSRWSIIAAQLPGRTDNDIKNYWNTKLKKKLLGKQRKENQVRRATSLTLKQEMKREIENYMVPGMVLNQAIDWPLLPPPVNQEMNFQYPLDHVHFAQHQLYENSINMLSSESTLSTRLNTTCSQVTSSTTTTTTTHFNVNDAGGGPNDVFQDLDGLQPELSELFYNNNEQILDGFGGFYGTDNMVDGSSTGTSSIESSSWGDIPYPQIVSGFEASQQQSIPIASTLDESSYFGPQ